LESVKAEGGAREQRILKEVKQVKQVAIAGVKTAKQAFTEANGVNAKIASLGQSIADNSVQRVEVVNTSDNPVPAELYQEAEDEDEDEH
jgi:hypothetical protein